MGGWTRCAERPPPRPWPSTRRGGRCSTRPCAHAIGPSSCSDPVRQQGWLGGHAMTQATPQGEKRSPAPTQPHLCFSRRQVWLNCPMTRTTPRGRRAVRAETAAPVPLALAISRACDWQAPVGWVVLLFLLICIRLIPSRLCSTTGNLTTPPVIDVVVSHDREPCGTVWGSMYPTCRVAVAGCFLLCLIRWLSLAGTFFVHLFCLLNVLPSFFVLFFD